MHSSEKKTLKDLHVASTLGELNKLADSGLPADSRSVNPATFIKSADKVYLKAKDHDFEGDEENAYVFYMRFFNIITLIKKSNKYTEKKKFYDDLMGKTKTSRATERAEALQKSLDKRYGKLKAQQQAKAKAEEEAKKKEEEDKKKLMSKSADNNGLDSDEFDLDSLLNGGGISSSADVYQKLKFCIIPESTMKVTKNAVTISELVNWNRFDLNRHTVQVRDADPNELQLFIEKMPASIKEKMQDLREANSTSRTSELETGQLRDFQPREENFQRQLRDVQQREENLRRQFRELQEREQSAQRQLTESRQREQNLQRQLRELQEREQSSQRQLTESQQREQNLQRQLRELQERGQSSQRQLTESRQREQNLQRQLREVQEQEQNSQRQLTEFQQREENSQRQLRNCQEQVSELQLSLSTAQLTINEFRSQEIRDWVIPRDEIQITEKCLGRGGWGSVNEGTYCGCTVAVKQIHDLILSPHNIHLFEREMNIASKCRHPHLLQFIGATKDEGTPLFVTELMEKSLRTLLEQRQLSETEIAVISLDVALALNYLHQRKPESIIHRDVSSANVLLWRQGDQWRGKVSDYGTANVIQQTMTVGPGAMIYSAPEALTSNQSVKVDVYSFGVLLCEMCIRQLPDPRRREEQVVLVTNGAFRGLVRRCLRREPGARPTMQEIIDQLKEFDANS